MRWCVASFADGDTHLAEPRAPGRAQGTWAAGRRAL